MKKLFQIVAKICNLLRWTEYVFVVSCLKMVHVDLEPIEKVLNHGCNLNKYISKILFVVFSHSSKNDAKGCKFTKLLEHFLDAFHWKCRTFEIFFAQVIGIKKN